MRLKPTQESELFDLYLDHVLSGRVDLNALLMQFMQKFPTPDVLALTPNSLENIIKERGWKAIAEKVIDRIKVGAERAAAASEIRSREEVRRSVAKSARSSNEAAQAMAQFATLGFMALHRRLKEAVESNDVEVMMQLMPADPKVYVQILRLASMIQTQAAQLELSVADEEGQISEEARMVEAITSTLASLPPDTLLQLRSAIVGTHDIGSDDKPIKYLDENDPYGMVEGEDMFDVPDDDEGEDGEDLEDA